MSYLDLSDSFEYLCYGSTAIINVLIFSVFGIVFIRQNLTSVHVRIWRLYTSDSDV